MTLRNKPGSHRELIFQEVHNDIVKEYTVKNKSTVAGYIEEIANKSMSESECSDKNKSEMDVFSQKIADKLVCEEMIAQSKIDRTGTKIKKGSLLQAFIYTEGKEDLYIIAKVEHMEFFDGESLMKSFGFPSEKKNIWKSAIFWVNDEKKILDSVKVYTDNGAKYWASSFLELNEERSDSTNTKKAYVAIDQELKRRVKKISERDYWLLNNVIYQKMKKACLFNYYEIVNDLLSGYQPDSPELDLNTLKKKLVALPKSKNFDEQFNTVPSELDRQRVLKYAVRENVELRISGEIENIEETIVSYTDEQGNRYIRIKCDETKTYQAFSFSK